MPEGKRKLCVWIPEDLYQIIEQIGYKGPTEAVTEGFKLLITNDDRSNIVNNTQITVTVTPYLKRRCVEAINGPDYTNISEIVTQALTEFFLKNDNQK